MRTICLVILNKAGVTRDAFLGGKWVDYDDLDYAYLVWHSGLFGDIHSKHVKTSNFMTCAAREALKTTQPNVAWLLESDGGDTNVARIHSGPAHLNLLDLGRVIAARECCILPHAKQELFN